MNKSRACIVTIAIAALLSVAVYARQQSPPPSAPTGLALEIVFLKGQPPSLYEVARSQATRPSGGWTGRFGRIVGWKIPDGALPIFAVQVSSRLEGGVVKVWVSVLLGNRSIEREEPVATYESREGEKLVVTELTKFGVEPIEIKVVRVGPFSNILPKVVNKTQSVMVRSITAKNTTLPSYNLSLQNLSSKNVVILGWHVLVDGKEQISATPGAGEDKPLIPSGGQYELSVHAAYQPQSTVDGQKPDLVPDQVVVIRAIVFSDGSYEGDPEVAANISAHIRGRKIEVPKVVALLQHALDSTDDASTTLRHLKDEIAALKTDADASEIDALLGKFPSLPSDIKTRLNSAMRAALNGIKRTASDDLDKFEKAQGTTVDKSAFRSWLLTTKEKYDQWLSRLNP